MIKIVELKLGEIGNYGQDINLCLGYFDAIHIGHVSLIKEANKLPGKTAVLTFDLPPKAVLAKRTLNCSLTSLYDKSLIFDKLGVEIMFYIPFNEVLSHMNKEAFINEILLRIKPQNIIVGDDYRFGYKVEGAIDDLKAHFSTTVVPCLKYKNKKVASSDIIELISQGDIDTATKLLGRYYQITGLVVEGNKIGRTIGFPTANLSLGYPYVLPQVGVYLGRIDIYGAIYYGIISVSTHPSIMELKDPIIEVNINDFNGNLYGKEISVEFLERIGDIKKFNSIDDLKAQLLEYQKLLISKIVKHQ